MYLNDEGVEREKVKKEFPEFIGKKIFLLCLPSLVDASIPYMYHHLQRLLRALGF